jgi:hypothetical protein
MLNTKSKKPMTIQDFAPEKKPFCGKGETDGLHPQDYLPKLPQAILRPAWKMPSLRRQTEQGARPGLRHHSQRDAGYSRFLACRCEQ